MSQEYAPSFFANQDAESFYQDYYDLLGTNDFGSEIPFDETYDFGAGQHLANVEFTGVKAQDPTAFEPEQTQDDLGLARGKKSSQNDVSLPVVSGQASSGTNKEAFGYTVNATSGPTQPSVDSISSPAAPLATLAVGKESSQPEIMYAYPTQPSGDGPAAVFNTRGISSGYESALMYEQNPQGTFAPVPQQFGNDLLQNTPLSGDNNFVHQQTQYSLSNVANQYIYNENQVWADHKAISSFQNPAGDNGQQQFPFDFNREDWQNSEAQMANEEFSETVDPVYHEPYPHGNVENTFNPTPTRVDTQQWSVVNESDIDSAHGTASISRAPTDRPIPATSNRAGNTSDHVSLGNLRGTSDGMSPAAGTLDASATVDAANNDESDEEDVPDTVAFETYEENDPVIVQDPRRRGRGRTGMRNGHQVWFNPGTFKWQPSVSHHDMRQTLIARAQAEYPNDRYLHPDPTDGLPHGETAFFKPHQYRGPDRKDCADILFDWRDYQPKKDADGKRIKSKKPKYIRKHPGFMFEGDRILLDPHNNPVVNHKFIPLTLSAHTDGGKLQEMYLHPDCHHVDLWARMPRWERMKDSNGNLVIVELRCKNTRINMPMTRFREKKGTIAGEDREGSDVIRAGLLSVYHQNGFDPVASGNSTKGFGRDFTGWEVKEVRLRNAAMFGERAGKRAIPEDKRQANLQKTVASIENGKKKRAANNGGEIRKRPHDQNADADDSARAPNKRVYQEPAFAPSHIAVVGSSKQGRGRNVSPSKTQRYGTHGALQTPHQNPNPMAVYLQPTAQYGGQTWPVQSPYEFNGGFATQHGPSQSNLGQPSGPEPYVPQHILRQAMEQGNPSMPSPIPRKGYSIQGANDGYELPQTLRSQGQDVSDEAEYNPYVFEENRQRMLRQGRSEAFARANMVPKRPMSNTNPAHHFSGPVNDHHYGPPVERQGPFERTNGAPKRGEDTLGHGGRKLYPAPKQVLGKRGQQGAGDGIAQEPYPDANGPATPNGIQQEEAIGQAIPIPDVGTSHKRQTYNGSHDPEPRPQHRRQGGKTPRPKHYGAGGAPEPFLLPEALSEALNPNTVNNGEAECPLKSPEELLRTVAPIFRFDSTGNSQGIDGDTFDESVLDFDWDAAGQDMHPTLPQLPHIDEPKLDDPKIPAYQATQVEEERLTPPQQPHIDEPKANGYPAPQVEDELLTPPQPHTSGEAPQVDEAPQVADAQGPDPPRAPLPAPADQKAAFDIRDVRPADGWQSQSLKGALGYTREAYTEWTGEEAPDTKLEDCFNVQYREIQAAFKIWWRSGKNPQRSDPLPELYQVEAWSGSVENWKAPENIDHLWEPIRRGKWAPRNKDGSLQQPEFLWNAEKYNWYDAEVVGQL